MNYIFCKSDVHKTTAAAADDDDNDDDDRHIDTQTDDR